MRVLVAMSGGVDSSVAAALLREQGHEVVGVTMKLWGGDSDSGCCSVADVDDARRAAQQLDVDHLVFGFADDFMAKVVEPYVEAHRAGRTPNPCIECNRHLKFDRLLERAELLGFDAMATGHHARVMSPAGGPGSGRLARGVDRAKDQSYVVHMVEGIDDGRVVLPIGELTKAQVRAEAHRLGLRTAAKPESQEVCFITRTSGRVGFLADRIPFTPGVVVDTGGSPVGRVDAVELVTIGQRKGLGGLGGGAPRYVVAVDLPTATVVVGGPEDLRSADVRLDGVVVRGDLGAGAVLAQCSAHGVAALAWFDGIDHLVWAEPQRRVAPGQSVVLYDETDTYVLAGGTAQ